ncbi:MAG: enoyl-ACP reductase [Nitrospinota bacterium]|nr:enoyl-ACP reductase [Nitrospinota bacterium]
MEILKGKKALIVGVANDRSIAWGIAKVFREAGCELGFTYAGEALGKRVIPLAKSLNAVFIEDMDVNNDEAIDRVFKSWQEKQGNLDILVHAVAFADKNDLKGAYYETSRAGFKMALETSAYSLVALSKRAIPLMTGRETSILTLSYYGAEKVVKSYNVMGVAKAALEASVRYLASDLGTTGIRVNAISAGPIKTLASSGINYMRMMLKHHAELSPMKRNTTQEEVGRSALYLCSDLSSGVTGEVVHVDSGYHIVGTPDPPSEEE